MGKQMVARDECAEWRDTSDHRDAIIITMRTTVNIPDEAYAVIRSVAQQKGITVGDAIADLVGRALNPGTRLDTAKAFPTFKVSPDAAPITLEQTLAAEDEI
jgi:hypothetical protein